MTETKKVVILGGGYAGIAAAIHLDKVFSSRTDVDITLVTVTETFFHNIGTLRSLVEPSFAEKLFIPYTKLFTLSKSARVVQGKVVKLDGNTVVLEDEKVVPFAYLIIATGSAYPSPSKMTAVTKSEGIAYLQSIAESIKNTNEVLVIGGGPVGVEMCGEITTDYPTKKITLVHSGSQLMPGPLSDKFKSSLLNAVRSRGVEVILNERVEDLKTIFPNPTVTGYRVEKTTVKTNKDRSITADCVILATGNARFNSDFIKTTHSEVVDEKGQIKVRPTMQLNSDQHAHIFAVGDVSDAGAKFGYFADQQAVIAAKNVAKLIGNAGMSTSVRLDEYKSPGNMAVVSVGRKGGVSQLGLVFGDWVTRTMKSKDMFTKKYWDMLNVGDQYKA